ncbi:MAG: S8 family serine peptidase, partial [Defluviitaleaceae bacterium]|nr:S8 family serine peptidase [Defluviitaleaceae bacterium]
MQNPSGTKFFPHPAKKTRPKQVVAFLLVFVLVFSLLGHTQLTTTVAESIPELVNQFGNGQEPEETLLFNPQSADLVQQDFSDFEVYEGTPDQNPAGLSDTERQRLLTYMAQPEPQGLQGFSEGFDSNPGEILDIIVQFVTPPSEVLRHTTSPLARLSPETQALAAHGAFVQQLDSMFVPFGLNPTMDIVQSYSTLFNGVQMLASAGLVYQIANLPEVFAISPNYEIYAQSTFPSPHTSMFMADPIDSLGIEAINSLGFTGAGLTVAVLDTGVDWNHPRLANNFVGGWCFIRNNDQPMEATFREWETSGQPLVDNRGASFITMHGTHVAGIVVGIAPHANISAYRVLGPFGRGSVANSIAAIEMAYLDGADIMNLSLGATVNLPFDPQAFAANVASLNGVVMVISAGNSGSQGLNSIGTPAVASLPITVGNGLWGGFGGNGFANAAIPGGSPFEVTVTGWGPGDVFADNTINGNIGFDMDASGYFAYVNVGDGTAAEFNAAGDLTGAIAVVFRGTSPFTEMLARAIEANAAALLIVNNQGNTRLANVMVQGERVENEIPVLSVRGADAHNFTTAGRLRLNALTLGVPA